MSGSAETTQRDQMSPADLKARVMAQVAARPSPDRRTIARETAVLIAASWALAIAVFLYAGGARVMGRPISLVLGTVVGTALATAVIVVVALFRGHSTLSRPPHILIPFLLGSPVAIFLWKISWSWQFAGAMDAWTTRPGFRCLKLGLALGVAPLLAFVVARRSSAPTRPALAGFAAGIAIGCVSALLTDLWCPVGYVPHLFLGHMLPIVILGGLGALLGRRFLGVDPESQRR